MENIPIEQLRWNFLRNCDGMPDSAALHLLRIESQEELIELRKLAERMTPRMVKLVEKVLAE